MSKRLKKASVSVRKAVEVATQGLVDRERLAELLLLGAVAGEHLLVIGPPGTAKSQVVRQVAGAMGGTYFEYLLGRFTEPSELFGPVDLRKLREGVVETETRGMLPEAHIAFLDEVFLGSTAILNTLLGLLNERRFKRGHTFTDCPLRICVGAANAIPEDETLAAFSDRFLLHVFLEPLSDALLEDLLEGGWTAEHHNKGVVSSLEDLDLLREGARASNPSKVRPQLAHALRLLRKAGVHLSDRRMVKMQRLVCAAAVLAGRTHPSEADLWPLVYAVPSQGGQELARETLETLLAESENASLPVAAEASSQGVRARAQRMLRYSQNLAKEVPAEGVDDTPWLLKLEALGREIDTCFDPEHLPDELVKLRHWLKGMLEAEA